MQSNPGTEKIDTIKFHDSIAGSYDEMLEGSIVAGKVRKKVHTKLLQYFKPGDHILDLNCGTGIDAIFLAKNGIYVTATDISPKMIEITRSKIKSENLNEYIDTFILDSENLPVLKEKNLSFDGVVSNFNGLNYLNDLRKFAQQLSALLKPGAPVLLTMLNKFCLREVLYYISRLKLSRGYNKATARENTLATRMKLYFPRTVEKIFSPYFTTKKITGFGIPASVSSSFPFYNICDQYLIEIERK